MLAWLRAHKVLMTWLGVLSGIMFVVGLVLVPVLVARMPADYFSRPEAPAGSWRDRHPLVRIFLHLFKNVLGVVLVVAGLAMLVLPGQGVLTILLGLAFLDLPGKRRIELWIVRRRPVKRAVDWLRVKAGQPPLDVPPTDLG